ncbi:unnamed protein product [Allacma fusca]|uniref:DUF4789 domain-containing protein n=1 Tax=Allacma fusca TaxID=39272 RepID=A0A8J2LR06_9HEXA|nr:unnamed protein product [Allacma fusca]
MKFLLSSLLFCSVLQVNLSAQIFERSLDSENRLLGALPTFNLAPPPTVPKNPGGGFGVPPAVPKNPGGDFGVPPAVPKNPGGDFGVLPAVPKNPGVDFGVPPAVPKNPGGGFGVLPAVPKNPGDFGVPPAVPKNPGGGFEVPPAVPKNPGVDFGVLPAVPKNPGGGFGVPPAVYKNPGGDFGVAPAVPKNQGVFGVPLDVPKNTGNNFGRSSKRNADDLPGVGPAIPKNPDGTPAISKEEILRRTLCGEADPSLRYDEKTKKCYRTSEPGGPCGENMRFYEISAVNGACDCSRDSGVPLVYHPNTDRCYFVYRQAYCRPRQWLLFNKNNNAVCVPNRCFNSRLKKQSWEDNIQPEVVPLNGTGPCVRLMSIQGCKDDYMVMFSRNRVVPTCSNPNEGIQTKFLSPVGILPCPAGSRASILGNCNPDVDWDF